VKQSDVNFRTTVARFQQLLGQNKYPESIAWLTPEDIVVTGRNFVYVRVPIPAANETNARGIYDEAVTHGRGLLLATICEMGTTTCCFVWYPRRAEEEPTGIWPQDGSAKLSAKTDNPRLTGKPVKSRLLWAFFKLRHRSKQNLKECLFR
jgi:hypothetical protein